MKNLAIAILLAAVVCAAEEKPLPVWRMPQVWPRHVQLRQQLIDVMKAGDDAKMEEICREALSAIPGDATWHYNLACALAKRGAPGALAELENAIRHIFGRKGEEVVNSNIAAIKAGRDAK